MDAQTQTTGTQTLIRTAILAVLIALLALATTQRVEANQHGPDVNSAATQQLVCKLMGGTVTVDTNRTVGNGLVAVTVRCSGSLVGDWHCYNMELSDPDCYWGRVLPAEDVTAPTTGEIVQVEEAPEPTPEIVEEVVILEPIEDPGTDEPGPAGETATPTPQPVEDPIVVEPEIIDEVIEPTDTEDPVQDGPVQDNIQVVDDIVVDPGPAEQPPVDEPSIIASDVVVDDKVTFETSGQ